VTHRQNYYLVPFPGQDPRSLTITGEVERKGSQLSVHYHVSGDLDQDVQWPEGVSGVFRRGLWEHTCLELFVGAVGEPSYGEWNFAPSGEWAAFPFKDYRVAGASSLLPPMPQITRLHRTPEALDLSVTLPSDCLSGVINPNQAWDIGITAVIRHPDASTTYWALRHAAQKPDFHQRESFAITLAP